MAYFYVALFFDHNEVCSFILLSHATLLSHKVSPPTLLNEPNEIIIAGIKNQGMPNLWETLAKYAICISPAANA